MGWDGDGDGVAVGMRCGWAVRNWECLLSATKCTYYVCFDLVLRYLQGMGSIIRNWHLKQNNGT